MSAHLKIAEWCENNAKIAANPTTPLGAQLEIAYRLLTELADSNKDLLEALEAAEKALTSLPHSWGFEFTDLPKIRAALKKAKP